MNRSTITSARLRMTAGALTLALCLPTTQGHAAATMRDVQKQSPAAISHPVEAGCRLALSRMGVKFMASAGPKGGCACLASNFEERIASDLHRPALEAFVLAVLARHTAEEQRAQVYRRFNALKERHGLEQESYTVMIGTMAQIINTCS